MHMNNDKMMKLKCAKVLIFTFISEKTQCLCSQHVSMDGENPCLHLHRDSTFSIVRYDIFAYGTAYLISCTKSNDPGSGGFSLGEPHDLRSPLRLAMALMNRSQR